MGRHSRYLPPATLHYRPVTLRKISFVLPDGQPENVGTYDLGRRYKVLHEGEYPPFKEREAVFLCARRGNKRLWGDRIG